MEFHLFLPQMRLSFDCLVASARAAEAAGFRGIAGMDHLVPPGAEARPAMVTETATRRFGAMQPVIGTGPELADHFAGLGDRGIERVYAWFCDFAPPDTLAAFGAEVIAPLAAPRPPAGREEASR